MKLGIIYLLLGGVFAWAFVAALIRRLLPPLRARRRYVETEGRLEQRVYRGRASGTSYRPVVSFTPPNGKRIEFLDPVESPEWQRQPGETVSVRYDPAAPARSATMAPDKYIFRGSIAIGLLSVIFCAMTMYGLPLIIGVLKPHYI